MARIELQNSEIFRGGVTARKVNFETDEINISRTKNALRIAFQLTSKGGGVSRVFVELGAADFPAVLTKMAEVDRHGTMMAISAELALQVSRQLKHDSITIKRAMKAMEDAAVDAYIHAPQDKNDAEYLVQKAVTRLIKKVQSELGVDD